MSDDSEQLSTTIQVAADLASDGDLADVHRRRARLLALAVADGSPLEIALDVAGRAELWLQGAPTTVRLRARERAEAKTGDSETTDDAPATLRELLRAVSDVSGQPVAWLKSHRRPNILAGPRQAFCWLARKYSTATFPEIGRFLGNRDHSTIMTAAARCEHHLRHRDEAMTRVVVEAARLCQLDLPAVYAVLDKALPDPKPSTANEPAKAAPQPAAAAPTPPEIDQPEQASPIAPEPEQKAKPELTPKPSTANEPAKAAPQPAAAASTPPEIDRSEQASPIAPEPEQKAKPEPTPQPDPRVCRENPFQPEVPKNTAATAPRAKAAPIPVVPPQKPQKLTTFEDKVLRAILRTSGTQAVLAKELEVSHGVLGRALRGLQRKRYLHANPSGVPQPALLPSGAPIPARRTSETDAMVEAALAEGKVTRCPPAYVAPVAGAEQLAPLPTVEDPAVVNARLRSARVNRTRKLKLDAPEDGDGS